MGIERRAGAWRAVMDANDLTRVVPIEREMAKRKIDGEWWQIDGSRTKRKGEGDHDWNWTGFFGERRGDLHREMVAVVTVARSASEWEAALSLALRV